MKYLSWVVTGLWMLGAQVTRTGTELSDHAWLRVKGPFLVDGSANPVRLVGMGIAPIPEEWELGGFPDLDAVVSHYRRLGCNAMRVAVYRNHAYNHQTDLIGRLGYERFIDQEIHPQVRAVIRQGMYVVLDWHHYANAEGLPGMSDARQEEYWYERVIPLWRAIAKRYASEPGVAIFELWNEPTWPGYSTGDPAQIPKLRAWYKACVKGIREVDKRHIVMLSDHNAGWGAAKERMWDDGSGLVAVDTLPVPQVVYSHHASAISELRGENADVDAFSRKYNVPVAYGEVELQRDVDASNKLLGSLQGTFLRASVKRQVANGLFQVWLGWRTGMDEWLDIWKPLRLRSSHFQGP